jgi:hypothetical protein
LLFLAKGEAQVAIAKWQWEGDWNNDHGDVKNWVALAGKDLDLKLDWIPARMDAQDTPAAKASLIFANGHNRFAATEQDAAFLRKFLANKGTLIAEGCCNSKVFVESFKEFVRTKLYPNLSIKFRPLTRGHAVCQQTYELSPGEISAIEVKTGCQRRRILILERDISCALSGEPCGREESKRAKEVAVNILQWAIRAKLPQGKLAEVRLAMETSSEEDTEQHEKAHAGLTRQYRQPFGRLIHRGEWDVDLSFFPTLRAALAAQEETPLFDGEVFVRPSAEDLFSCAVLYVTGHEDPRLRSNECLHLRTYLQNGGCILASACCGAEHFDRGFRRMVKEVLPNDELVEIPPTDSVWKAPYAVRSLPVMATKAYAAKHGQKLAPLYGIRREGRWIVLYSAVDLCCDLEGDLDDETLAYKKETAVPVWANLLHYLFTP